MFRFSLRSLKNLDGVHPNLVAVAKLALTYTEVDFVVIEGVRNRRRQEQLVKSGASQTLDSYHLTGHAIDVAAWANGQISWAWPHYHKIADAFKRAAEELCVDLTWGGDWKSFQDGPHFQISRNCKASDTRTAKASEAKKRSSKPRASRKKSTSKKAAAAQVM